MNIDQTLLEEISKVVIKEDNNSNRKLNLLKALKNNYGWHFSDDNILEKDYTIHNKNSDQITFKLNFFNEDYIAIIVNDRDEIGRVSIINNANDSLINLRIEMHIQKYVNNNFNN